MNEVIITGKLNELSITEGTTKKGKPWVYGTAEVVCDQVVCGEPVETRVEVRFSCNRYKKHPTDPSKNGEPLKLYDTIVGYKDKFTSIAAAETPEQASEVTINGARLEENLWVDANGTEHTGWIVRGSWMKKKLPEEKEGATFKVSAYIFKMDDELDKNGDPTGRIKLTVGVVGYDGKIHRLEMFASGAYKAHIEQNWNPKETVNITGRINMIRKVETYTEDTGFGEPIEKTRSVFKKELIVTGGSPYGLAEEASYDEDSIRKACAERSNKIEEMKVESKKKAAKPKTSSVSDYGF